MYLNHITFHEQNFGSYIKSIPEKGTVVYAQRVFVNHTAFFNAQVSYKLIKYVWKKSWTLLTKIVLTNLIRCGGSNVLLWFVATQWSRERLGPGWPLVLDFSLVCIGLPKVAVLVSFFATFFPHFVSKKREGLKNMYTLLQGIPHYQFFLECLNLQSNLDA